MINYNKSINNIKNTNNKSPLRYPGGKTRACKLLHKILEENFKLKDFNTIISPFFGCGSFEFYIQNIYKLNIIANDKFTLLSNFWNICKYDCQKKDLCDKLYKCINQITKEDFAKLKKQIISHSDNEKKEDNVEKAFMYFIINRCSFSGSTLSGGFSLDASKKRFTISSIGRIKDLDLYNFTICNDDFEDFINKNDHNNNNNNKNIIFLDPPYYLENKSKLYGNNGDMHENFDHERLFRCILHKKDWIMTYNNCDYIKNLYKDFKIIETSWSYGMNKSKKSSEIVIIG